MTNPINTVENRLRRSKYRHAIIESKELFMIAIATIPYSLVVNQILVPHAIVGGGLTGLCEIIYFATGTVVPIWLSSLVINVILLAIAIKVVGWEVLCSFRIWCLFPDVVAQVGPYCFRTPTDRPFHGCYIGGVV